MKYKVIVKDKNGQTSGEVNTRDYDILRAREKNPATVVRNRKKYTRKVKHKNKLPEAQAQD